MNSPRYSINSIKNNKKKPKPNNNTAIYSFLGNNTITNIKTMKMKNVIKRETTFLRVFSKRNSLKNSFGVNGITSRSQQQLLSSLLFQRGSAVPLYLPSPFPATSLFSSPSLSMA